MTKFITIIKAAFNWNKLGLLLKILLQNAAQKLVMEIMDKENQQKAYEFVKELHCRKDMSPREKAETFNLKMMIWCRDFGKQLSSSTINMLRELALSAFKSELERIETEKLEAAQKTKLKTKN